jgi:hypothetical protein
MTRRARKRDFRGGSISEFFNTILRIAVVRCVAFAYLKSPHWRPYDLVPDIALIVCKAMKTHHFRGAALSDPWKSVCVCNAERPRADSSFLTGRKP